MGMLSLNKIYGLFLEIYPNEISIDKSLLISLIAIIMVFVVLVIIIFVCDLMKIIFFKNKKQNNENETKEVKNNVTSKKEKQNSVKIVDDDMQVAALIATIDYANETKKDVILVSIKQIN